MNKFEEDDELIPFIKFLCVMAILVISSVIAWIVYLILN